MVKQTKITQKIWIFPSPHRNLPKQLSCPPSSFKVLCPSIEHNDGGANCFISNDQRHFVNFLPQTLHVKQLDGSIAKALGFGLKLIQHHPSNYIILLWPTYFMPQNSHCTFSPTALRHYLKYPSVTTHHLQSIQVTTPCNQQPHFPSILRQAQSQLLDFHEFFVVQPTTSLSSIPRPIANKSTSTFMLSRALVHQRLGHGSDKKLDIIMCHLQTLSGLPKRPFPPSTQTCPICVKAKFIHAPKGKTMTTSHLSKGEYLHMDFAFWDVPSLRQFTGMLVIIDAKTRMLWLFCTSGKRPPLHILTYFFDIMKQEGCTIKTIRVDEEGSLARNAEFTTFLLNQRTTLDTTGGYSSFLNGKVERPHQTISQLVRAMLINLGHSRDTWCYCAETAADIYRYTYHSSINMSPYESWYQIKPFIAHLRVWGCMVYIKTPSPKKSEDCVIRGYFMGFTKSRLVIRWLDPTTCQVKHAFAVKFDEHCTPTSVNDHISPGSFLLSSDPTPILSLPDITINTTDHPLLDSPMFDLHVSIPPHGTPIGCTILTCTYYNLPYISTTAKGSSLATGLSKFGPYNTTFWILSINDKEFSTAATTARYLSSLQLPSATELIHLILARRHATYRSTVADNRTVFNQIKLSYQPTLPANGHPTPTIVPAGLKVITLPDRPTAPNHIGQLSSNPLISDWKEAIFDNFTKMQRTGTWSAPLLCTLILSHKQILRPRISFRVKDTATPNTYELQGRTCADGSKQKQFVDFIDSYSPVGAIDSIRLLLALAASSRLTLHVLDISNAFQNSIIFDPDERVYISLPPFYLD
jgi:hypothetical protein